jgi:hypothetical protein
VATAWAEVAVAATELNPGDVTSTAAPEALCGVAKAAPRSRAFGNVVMAALALPAVLPMAAQAETAPEQGLISLRYLSYQDQQKVTVKYPTYDGTEPSKLKRITAKSPSIYVLAPIGTHWSLETSGVQDEVSGATPRFYTDVSGASVMHDKRKAGDIKVTRHFDRAGVSLGASHSTENDYKSTAFSLDTRFATDDNNTTFNLGFGGSRDTINPVNGIVTNASKRTSEVIVGLTQALNANDLVQINGTYSDGKGYFNDPYKLRDVRPDQRKQVAGLARWNHYFSGSGSTFRSSYRYYRDTFGIRAHTAEMAWVEPMGSSFFVTPSVRYHDQSSARFYYDPVPDASIYPGPLVSQQYHTVDQRMSAFGAVTLGLRAELKVSDWMADVSYEHYEQRARWRLFGTGSPSLDIFSADSVQVGLSKKF